MDRSAHFLAPVSRRTLLGALVLTPALAVLAAACGDPDDAPVDAGSSSTDTDVPSTGVPSTGVPSTDAPATGYVHSTDADAAVIRLGFEGGFVAPGTMFVNLPTLLVSGDGRAFRTAAVTLEYPGQLVSPLGVRTISEEGVQRLLGIADTAGLLAAAPDYAPAQMNIADAPDTVLTVTVDGQTYRHQAYALSMDMTEDGTPLPEQTPARQALADVVSAFGALETTLGAAALGEETIFEPDAYRFQAMVITDDEIAGYDPAAELVEWPATAGVTLASAADCGRVGAAAIGSLFAEATQLTFFTEAGVTYRVTVAAVLPGDGAC